MNFESLAIFAAITLSLTSVVKSFFKKPDGSYPSIFKIGKFKFHWGQVIPAISLVFGVLVITVFSSLPLKETIGMGVIVGLMAGGSFSGVKATLPENTQE